MREVHELLPTEGLLLLDIKLTTGQQLLAKTIEEFVLLGVIGIETRHFEDQKVVVVSEKNFENSYLKDYHNLFLASIREHYQAYSEVTAKNALTPKKLIGSVRYKLDFNDKNYKFGHIYDRLKLWELAKNRFPHYYINKPLTRKGEELRSKLKGLIDSLDQEVKTNKDKNRLSELSNGLGFNVILIPGVFKELGQNEFDKPKYFVGPGLEIQNSFLQWEILDRANLHVLEPELFDLPDDIDD
ncbi:hypothetical protein [Chryseolinea sp. H1M3-3]|uniref:hypothetical protein n=1 Tax=Chryseolinea sp. H1M3-3 TaxID=3034144 RepID=UPI0023EE0C43|nr:hypothetical protein [Chryseolinea sp. H1M3-3]